jgi:hypothetical protein
MSKAAERSDLEVIQVGDHFGSYCPLCGDYLRSESREEALHLATRGCHSCKPDHKKRMADAAVVDMLEFK